MQSKTDFLDITNTVNSTVECYMEKSMWQKGWIEGENLLIRVTFCFLFSKKKNIKEEREPEV